jgi:hypothetical protein
MAVFNPTPNPTSDPNYLGMSKEPDKIKADTSFGDLFKEAGSLIDGAAGAIDRGITDIWKDEARTKLSALIEDPSMRAPAAPGQVADPDVPAGVTDRIEGLRRLQSAASLRPDLKAKFDLEVAKVSKEIRSKWPGHTDQIDTYIKAHLGTSSANEARESVIQAQAQAARQASSAQNKLESEYQRDEKYYNAAGISRTEFMRNPDAAINAVGDIKGREFKLDLERQGVVLKGLEVAPGDRNLKIQAERSFINTANHHVSIAMGRTIKELQDQADAIRANPKSTGAEIQQADAQLQIALGQIERQLYQLATQPLDKTGKNPGSYATVLDSNTPAL